MPTVITSPPAAPSSVPSRSDAPDVFSDNADAFAAWIYAFGATWMPTFITQLTTLETNVEAQEASAEASAATAVAAAANAVIAAGNYGTSTTSLSVSTTGASVSLTIVEASKTFPVGSTIVCARTTDPAGTRMVGIVTSWNSGTGAMQFTVVDYTGSGGPFTNWTVSLSGPIVSNITKNYPAVSTSAVVIDSLLSFSVMVTAPSNAVSVPTAITTSDGWSIAPAFVAGTLKTVAPLSRATAHGTWGTLAMTPPVVSTATGSGTITVLSTAQLDTDLQVVIYRDGSNVKAIAVKPSTGGQSASPVTLGTWQDAVGAGVFKLSTTSFAAFFNSGAAQHTQIAGSVNASTLVITLGSGVNAATLLREVPAQATGGVPYFMKHTSGANDLQGTVVSGTTVTNGTAIASSSYSPGTGSTVSIRGWSTSVFMAAHLTTGGGTSTTRGLTVSFYSINTSTGNLSSTGSGASAATNIAADAGLRILEPFNAGGTNPSIIVTQNGSTPTSGNFYGLSTGAGPSATISTVTTRASDLPTSMVGSSRPSPFLYMPAVPGILYNTSTFVFGHLATGPYAVTISGSTLTFGSATALGGAMVRNFLKDVATGANFYAVGASMYDKFTISGTTITASANVAVSPTIIVSDTVNDKAVSYSSTWYTWTLSPTAALSSSYWTFTSGNNLTINGAIA